MNLKYFYQLQILLRNKSMHPINFTKDTINEIKKLKPGWYCFDKPTLDEYISYNNDYEISELPNEEYEELKAYYKMEFEHDKVYYCFTWENNCLVINNKVVYIPNQNEGEEADYCELFKYLNTAKKAEDLPIQFYFGIIKRKDLYDLVPLYRENSLLNKKFNDKDLNAALHKKIEPIQFTKESYLQACYICYQANNVEIKDDIIESYKKNADGRDDELLNIDNTIDAFNTWKKESHYGHPYEIMRGGNSTHISLYPMDEGYYLIRGKSWTRSMETLNAFVALAKNNIPVKLADEDIMLNRYYEEDYVGILPNYIFYSYYNNEFKELFNINVEDSFTWNSFEMDIDIKKLIPYIKIKKEGDTND